MRTIVTILLSSLIITSISQSYIPGYKTTLSGEELTYHSPQPDARISLLVRSEDSARFIEWESAGTLQGFKPLEGVTTFLLLAGIDVNPEDPHSWKFLVNDRHLFTISSPMDTLDRLLEWTGPDSTRLEFKVTKVDKYGDFMGYLYLHLPASMLEPGKPVRIKVVGESAGSRTWFMVFKYETVDGVKLVAENAIMRTDEGNRQILRTEIVHYGDTLEAEINVGSQKFDRKIGFGYQSLQIPVPEITRDTAVTVRITAGLQKFCDTVFSLRPVPYRTIYLLHHSHNDIGYTHVQNEVEEMQWKNLDDAVKLAGETKDYPEGAQLKWNVEVMWAVVSYLEKATPEKKAAFIEAVKNGWIELDALYANELVSLCESQELLQLMEPARRIARECGVPLLSAMISDIPGWSWGMVPALSLSGVKYLSLGTNAFHRIGNTIKVWGDKPFYWVSPSGEERLLCWIHEEGYSLFHTGLDYKKLENRLQEIRIFDYMNELTEKNYPYDIVTLRYNVGSDNGPVDDSLPEAVKKWNEKFVTPKIVISTVGEAFRLFEEKYGSQLPEVSGDFTAFWEDGAFSTTRETILNRTSSARLNQAQVLRSLMKSEDYPAEAFREAWKNILLYHEHTWGSWNSISEPESEFTLSQWAIKESFARKAHEQSSRLFMETMPELTMEDIPLGSVEVVNTCSWNRTGPVSIPAELLPPDPIVIDPSGQTVPTQLLSNGQVIFIAKDIPSLGSKTFAIKGGQNLFRLPDEGAPAPVLSNRDFELQFDEVSGAISKLTWKEMQADLADTTTWAGLNQYIYVEGRSPEKMKSIDRVRIMKGEEGIVMKSIRIISKPPGCRYMETEVELFNGLGEIYITNTIDKEKILEQEAVHIAFPFRVPGGIMRYDMAFGYCEVEKDQIKGSNRNFITMENWLDISNENFGVTVACPDVPLFEVDSITMDEVVTGWVEKIGPSQNFFSYVMNNYWETNYAAAQEGVVSFSYVIRPHKGFDPVEAERFGLENRYPLAAIPGNGKWEMGNGKWEMFSSLILISLKPTGNPGEHLACLYNASEEEVNLDLDQKKTDFYRTDVDGLTKTESIEELKFPPKAIRFLLVVNK